MGVAAGAPAAYDAAMANCKRTGLREQVLGDEILVFDEQADKVHVLNVTSAFVWKSLDETAEPAVLAERLRAHFKPAPDADVDGVVRRALEQFARLNLLAAAG